MTRKYIESVSDPRPAQELADTGRLNTVVSTPHLVTGFFLMAVATAVAVFIAGTMDSQVRIAGVAMVAVFVTMIIFWMIVAQPTLAMLSDLQSERQLDRERHLSIQHAVHVATAQQEQSASKVGRLGMILTGTQNQLAQEIAGLGAAVRAAVDEASDGPLGAEVAADLNARIGYVEEGQRNLAAISRLGTTNRTDRIGAFRASDVAPLPAEATVVVDRDDEIFGDVDLWRVFIKNAARNAEVHGRASEFTVSTGGGRLIVADDGEGCRTDLLERAWKTGLRPNGTRSDGMQIMRRVAEVHDGSVTLTGEPGRGVRIEVDLRDLEIDLSDRRVATRRIRTPHKASGGRTTSLR